MPQQAGTAVKRPAQEFPAAATRAAKSKKMKSAAYVDGEAEGGASSTAGQTSNKTSAVKKPKASRAPRAPREGGGAGSNKGIHVELNCSPALSELIGVPIVCLLTCLFQGDALITYAHMCSPMMD